MTDAMPVEMAVKRGQIRGQLRGVLAQKAAAQAAADWPEYRHPLARHICYAELEPEYRRRHQERGDYAVLEAVAACWLGGDAGGWLDFVDGAILRLPAADRWRIMELAEKAATPRRDTMNALARRRHHARKRQARGETLTHNTLVHK